MITLGLVDSVDTNGVYVTMPGSKGVLRGPYRALSTVAAGTTVLVASTDDGEQVVVGAAPGGDGVFSVLSFGAVGDGVTDDSAAIQAALDLASELSAAVVVPPGIYRTGATLTVGSNTRISGTGTISGLVPGALGVVMLLEDVSNVVIEGITIDGNKSAYSGVTEWKHGLSILSSRNVTVRNVTARDCKGDGVYVGIGASEDPSGNITLQDVVADGNHRQGLSVVSVDGLRVIGGEYINTSGTAPQAGIDIEPNGPEEVLRDVSVIGAKCEGNDGYGLLIVVHDESQGGITISGCSMSNNDQGLSMSSAHRVVVSNCSICSNTQSGIHAGFQTDSTVRNVTVADCEVSDNGDYGVRFGGPASGVTVKHVAVTRCKIMRNASIGISLAQYITFDNVVVNHCRIADNTVGVEGRGTGTGLVTTFNAIGNEATTDTTHGFYIYNSVSKQTHFKNRVTGTTVSRYAFDGGKGADTVVIDETAPAVTGSRGGNAALASLLAELAGLGLIVDSST